jgi:heat-inducible transcriptional repressor
MEERQKSLLNLIIREYIKTALPIGSKFIVERGGFKLSPATIRKEMAELEKEGYIYQPHTSAGRVPTEKGYRFYIDNLLKEKELKEKEEKYLKTSLKKAREEKSYIKSLAKTMAELSSEAVLIGFGPDNFFYTGLTNLFSQPEFASQDLVYNISLVIDHLDEVAPEMFDQIGEEAEILIGQENPLARDCSIIIAKYRLSRSISGIIGILGPIRMDYESNLSLVKYAQKLLAKER